MKQEIVPQVGDQVLHRTKIYYGKVVGHGRRLTQEGVQITLKVGVPSQLTSTQIVIVEDLAAHWERMFRRDI